MSRYCLYELSNFWIYMAKDDFWPAFTNNEINSKKNHETFEWLPLFWGCGEFFLFCFCPCPSNIILELFLLLVIPYSWLFLKSIWVVTYCEFLNKIVCFRLIYHRPGGGIEPLRLSTPTGLKPAPQTTEGHLDTK